MSPVVALAAVSGMLTWSLLEYCIHRWLGHGPRAASNLFGTEHTRHHAIGDYFAPTWKKAVTTAVTTLALGTPAVALGGWEVGGAWALGLVGFYVFYEVLHRLEHVFEGVGPYGRWARRHHFHHHFHDPRVNHGVTSPLWDLVFRTYARPGRIRVPERLAMRWLLDPATGEVRSHLSVWYETRRRRPGLTPS